LKTEGVFQISRQKSDGLEDQHTEQSDTETDMKVLEKAGLRESFQKESNIPSPRILPASFMRRLSETEYEGVDEVVNKHILKFGENPSKDPYTVE